MNLILEVVKNKRSGLHFAEAIRIAVLSRRVTKLLKDLK